MKRKYKIQPKKQYIRKPRGLSGLEFNNECKKYGLISHTSVTRPFELVDIYTTLLIMKKNQLLA